MMCGEVRRGAIQVDSPPCLLARPVGGKPGVTASDVSYITRVSQKVAKLLKLLDTSTVFTLVSGWEIL